VVNATAPDDVSKNLRRLIGDMSLSLAARAH